MAHWQLVWQGLRFLSTHAACRPRQHLCESFGQYLTDQEAAELARTGLDALHLYLGASMQAASMSLFSWVLLPKMHIFDHLNQDLKAEAYNPRWFHNFGGEDFMGVLKAVCSQCAGEGMSIQVLRRTLLRLVTAKPLSFR